MEFVEALWRGFKAAVEALKKGFQVANNNTSLIFIVFIASLVPILLSFQLSLWLRRWLDGAGGRRSRPGFRYHPV